MGAKSRTKEPQKGPAKLVGTHTSASMATSDTFAARLNRLFATVYPPGSEPYSNEGVIQALASRGTKMSAPYLSQLRTGQRCRPSKQKIAGIAEFFGIHPDYFTGRDESYRRAVEDDLDVLELARNPGARVLTIALAQLEPSMRERVMAEAGI